MSTLMSDPTATPTRSNRLNGYEIIRPLGEGAGSIIYVVRDPSTGRNLALKHVVRKNEKDIRFIDQLVNEFEIGKKVSHASMRRMIDLKVERTLLRRVLSAVVVMELIDGRPLDHELPAGHAALVRAFIRVADALGAMHKAGYVHCDLKPANILYHSASTDPDNSVRLIDLGQACPSGTKKERIQGTPDYISPEQVKRQPVDERTDVYSFGATLYWCLCAQRMPTLFTLSKGDNSFLVDEFIKSPRDCNPQVPESLSSFVMECAKTNPARRPANMQAVIQRLEVILIGLERVKPD